MHEPTAVEPPSTALTGTPEAPIPVPRGSGTRLGVVLAALVVAGAWGILALWGLGDAAFHTKGEPREGLVVWEMTHDGGWILPKRNGSELPSKPPLFHWMGALTSIAQGHVDEWSIRFPSSLLSLLGALLVLGAGAAWWSVRAGLLAALSLMTTFEWARAATIARVDMTLTFGLELAALSLFFFWQTRRRMFLAPLYLGMAWAVLGKGPVGVALPVLAAAFLFLFTFNREALATRRWSTTFDFGLLSQFRPARGALVILAIAGTWYVLALYVGGWPFFRKQILAENLFTYLEDADFGGGHRHGLLYLPGQLLLGLLPWTLFLPSAAATLYRKRHDLTRHDARTILLLWIGIVFTFYEFAAIKRVVYLLALYPAAALLLGWWWDRQWTRIGADSVLARVIVWLCNVLLIVLGLAGIVTLLAGAGLPITSLLVQFKPKLSGDAAMVAAVLREVWLALSLAILCVFASLVVTRQAALRKHWNWIYTSFLLSITVILVAGRIVVMPAVAQQLTPREFMSAVRAQIGDGSLCFYKTFDYGAVYYSQRHIPPCSEDQPIDRPSYALMQRRDWESLGPDSPYRLIELATATAKPFPLVLTQRIPG